MSVPERVQDPRLKRIFAQDLTDSVLADAEPTEIASPSDPRADPRSVDTTLVPPPADPRRRSDAATTNVSSSGGPGGGLDIQIVLQKSLWYQALGSNNKILVSRHLAELTGRLKQFSEEVALGLGGGPHRVFDISGLCQQNPMLASVMHQLGIYVNEAGEIQMIASNSLMHSGAADPTTTMMMMNSPMTELAQLIQQQPPPPQQVGGMNMSLNLNPMLMQQQRAMLCQNMGQQMLGRPPPGLMMGGVPNMGGHPFGFDGGPGPPPGNPGQDMNFMMNFNDNSGGGCGPPLHNHQHMNNNNNRGHFRNNNRNNNDRPWNNNNRGGNRNHNRGTPYDRSGAGGSGNNNNRRDNKQMN